MAAAAGLRRGDLRPFAGQLNVRHLDGNDVMPRIGSVLNRLITQRLERPEAAERAPAGSGGRR